MFNVKRLQYIIATETIKAKANFIHGDYYCQVLGNKEFFVEAYPMEKKSDYHYPLDKFVKYYGVPDSMIYNDAQE